MNTKEQVAASIDAAKADLETALKYLRQLPALDGDAIRYTAHILGNYLSITSGCVQLLGVALAKHADPDVHGYLHALERMTDVMTFVARHLTHASAAHEVPLNPEKVELSRLARRASDYYQTVAAVKQIEVNYEETSPAMFVRADRIALATVLDNLLSNAIKFSQPAKRIWVRVAAEPGHVVCAVQDEGPGLTPEERARLFRKGERLGPVPTGGETSTGYGLAIARDLMERMGGNIWCESQPGQGATFVFRLPAYVGG
ncbi:MAG TPA: HAMP domain-containing sensor histidine kinase [Gemmataceae bacterium]|nr:HAMP domain-containing sensor histidine kinase [Gemmataceae bacterium]